MADLSQLYKVAPNTAAFMTGGQQATDDQNAALDQQKLQQVITQLQQQNQQASVINPLLVQHQQAVNQAQQQGIDLTSATQPGTIAKTNSDNTNAVTNNNIAGANAVRTFLTNTAGALEQAPPPARQGILMSELQRAHLDPSDPAVAPLLKVLNDVPLEHLPLALNHMADTLTAHSPAYKQATDVENLKAASAEKVGAGNNAARIKSAEITAAALRDRAVTMANSKIKATPGFWDNYAKLKRAADQLSALQGEIAKVGIDTPEGQQMAVMAKAIEPIARAQLNAAQPKPGSADASALGLPTNPSIDLLSGTNKPKTGTTKSGAKYTIIN